MKMEDVGVFLHNVGIPALGGGGSHGVQLPVTATYCSWQASAPSQTACMQGIHSWRRVAALQTMASLSQFVILCTGPLVLPEKGTSTTKMGANITVWSSLPDVKSPCKAAFLAAVLEASLTRRSGTLQKYNSVPWWTLAAESQNRASVRVCNSRENTACLLSLFRGYDTAR
jgi:hypothetical protein